MSRTRNNMAVFSLSLLVTTIVLYWLAMLVGWGTTASLAIAGGMAVFTLAAGALAYAVQAHRHRIAFSQKQKMPGDASVEQTRIIEIDVPFEQAFDLALTALQSLDGQPVPRPLILLRPRQALRLHRLDREMGRIEAGLRARTAGITDLTDFSRLNIQLQRLDATMTRLHIEAAPTSPIEMFDMGRHSHYVSHLALTLRRASQASAAHDRLATNEQAAPHEDAEDNARASQRR